MTPFEAYREYYALKMHFSGKYDYIKYNGKLKPVTIDSFKKRNDQLFFLKLAKHLNPKGFLISNFIKDDKKWIGSLVYNDESEKIYNDWVKRNNALLYTLKNDIIANVDLNTDLLFFGNQCPRVVNSLHANKISLESFIIIFETLQLKQRYDEGLSKNIIWKHIRGKVEKYAPFLSYDKEEAKNIIHELSRR